MAGPVLYPTIGQFSMVSKETTPGVPTSPVASLPMDKFQWEDKPVEIDDKGLRGVMGTDFGYTQGVYMCDVSALGGPVYPDTIGYPIGNIMGDITSTGTTAPFKHVISLLNPTASAATGQGTTQTWTHYYGPTATSGARQVPSFCLSQLVFTWEAATGLLTWSGKGQGFKSVPAASRPTFSPSAIKPFPGWAAQLAVGGVVPTQSVTNLEKATITINRELELEYTGNAVQNPLAIGRAGLSVTFDFQFLAQDETYYNDLLNNTQPQIQVLFTAGAGAALTSFQIDMQQGAWVKNPVDYSKKFVRWQSNGKPIFNSTNVGASGGQAPIQFTLQNAITAGTYI